MSAPAVDPRTLIRSRKRVRDLAEVFTPARIVRQMLDLVGEVTHLPETTFLEPSCGNGNFLVEILDRKLKTVFARHRRAIDAERQTLRSIMSIYGVDIDATNVGEARERLAVQVDEAWAEAFGKRSMTPETRAAIKAVLARNVRVCDFLKGRHECVMTEYVGPIGGRYVLKNFSLAAPSVQTGSRGYVTLSEIPVVLAATQPAPTHRQVV